MIFLELLPLPFEQEKIEQERQYQEARRNRDRSLHALQAAYDRAARRGYESVEVVNDTNQDEDTRIYQPIPEILQERVELFFHFPLITFWQSGVAYPFKTDEAVLEYATKFITVMPERLTGRLFIIFESKLPADVKCLITTEPPSMGLFMQDAVLAGPGSTNFVVKYDLPNNLKENTAINIMIAPNGVSILFSNAILQNLL